MKKLDQAIETLKSLSIEERDFFVDWVLDVQSANEYELTDNEVFEVERRLAAKEEIVSAETVFSKFGL